MSTGIPNPDLVFCVENMLPFCNSFKRIKKEKMLHSRKKSFFKTYLHNNFANSFVLSLIEELTPFVHIYNQGTRISPLYRQRLCQKFSVICKLPEL